MLRASWFVASAVALLSSCAAPLERFEFAEPHMGTQFRVVLYASSASQAQQAAHAAFARVAALDRKLSDYDAASEVRQLCARTDAGAPTETIVVSDDLWRALETSIEFARRTDGAFDPTVGPLTELWRRARRQGELPGEAQVERARAAVGWKHVELDPIARTVSLRARGMRLDFGGIGKGFALDQAMDAIQRCDVERAMVVGGGEVRVGRAPPGRTGWRIELAPFVGESAALAIELESAAVATSGDASQALELDGERHSHILDPRTGRALTRRTAATVIARDSTTADALATALCVLGPSAGLALADATPGVQARIATVDAEGVHATQSAGFPRSILSPPSSSPRSP